MTISMGVASRAHRVVAGFMIALAAVFVVLAAPASAQTWPSQPIKLIVPHAPGGVTDLVARLDMIASRPNDKVDPLPQNGMP